MIVTETEWSSIEMGTPREPGKAGRVGRRRKDAADMKFSQFRKESAETEWSSIEMGVPTRARQSGSRGEKEEQRSTVEETAAAKSDCRF